jgi:SpoVK/Ycf46/Vps4 family AAA+-type ATPase
VRLNSVILDNGPKRRDFESTGKISAAQLLVATAASALNACFHGIGDRSWRRDLFPVDLSAVVSKYIGETEKNLAGVFASAEATDAILVVDAADALFGKGADVQDTHGRYSKLVTEDLRRRVKEI